ncbi:hypothetical protein HD553DRAFT_302942 [Filobasidium floriforme]|uniref:uncharacterized protein n=1 Tax=Filobasidium floriforme TaxID=5210 RepID=UPI001E8DAF53|nr:uncharacterized protein HD553DRAFT_302942 [Filobasidium floriforme]KAH8090635.1 hypothetical protein HD553DRAFT_302942 [Filobasidium floriforme]
MINARKRHRSPSTSSDELDRFRRPHPHANGGYSTREPTLSPSRADDTTDLDTSDGEYLSAGHGTGHWTGEGPARKRRRGVLRNKMEKMGLVNEEPISEPQAFPSSVTTGWNLPTQENGPWVQPTATLDDSGLNLRETSARDRIPYEDLGRVAYPTTIESPLEETSSWGEASSASIPPRERVQSRDEGHDEDDSMMMDQNEVNDDNDNNDIRGTRRKRQKTWYEPEKDRIVVTSLSDSEDDDDDNEAAYGQRSRSDHGKVRSDGLIDLDDEADIIDITHRRADSPDRDQDGGLLSRAAYPYDNAKNAVKVEDDLAAGLATGKFTQPGVKGFTISPSLLSRLNQLNERQRAELSMGLGLGRGGWDDSLRPGAGGKGNGRGLVLYKALPGTNPGAVGGGYSVRSTGAGLGEEGDMGSRFELVQDDDDGVGRDDVTMEGGMEVDDGQMVEQEQGQQMEMEDMEMG